MSGTFLDDVLMQVALDAYRAAGRVTEATLEERTGPGPRYRPGTPMSREPAVQALVDWQALGPSAARALTGTPRAGRTTEGIIGALNGIPAPRTNDVSLEPRPEIIDLTKSFDLAAEMITTARLRKDFTAEHAATTVARLATAVGAISRISAAAATRTESSARRSKELSSFDALTSACRARPDTPQGEVPSLEAAQSIVADPRISKEHRRAITPPLASRLPLNCADARGILLSLRRLRRRRHGR